jgi:hypothetical protein
MKCGWLREEYIKSCTRKEINDIAWLKAGASKLRGNKRRADKEDSLIYWDTKYLKVYCGLFRKYGSGKCNYCVKYC